MTIACTLTGAEQIARRDRWLRLAECNAVTIAETTRGLRLSFRWSPSLEQELQELAELERECCAFASWTVRRTESTVCLDVEAEGDAVAAVHGMFTTFPRS